MQKTFDGGTYQYYLSIRNCLNILFKTKIIKTINNILNQQIYKKSKLKFELRYASSILPSLPTALMDLEKI